MICIVTSHLIQSYLLHTLHIIKNRASHIMLFHFKHALGSEPVASSPSIPSVPELLLAPSRLLHQFPPLVLERQ
jgi:hypothetical protein